MSDRCPDCPGHLVRHSYDVGYRDGESNHWADWDNALDEVLPNGVESWPTQVRDYILSLQADADRPTTKTKETSSE